jgi:alpha-galactosidase/6-phospho-beta-glucosidase family protein
VAKSSGVYIHPKNWDEAEQRRSDGHQKIARMVAGEQPDDELRTANSEGALEVIENIAKGGDHYHLAVNLPNRGYISNLPMELLSRSQQCSAGPECKG